MEIRRKLSFPSGLCLAVQSFLFIHSLRENPDSIYALGDGETAPPFLLFSFFLSLSLPCICLFSSQSLTFFLLIFFLRLTASSFLRLLSFIFNLSASLFKLSLFRSPSYNFSLLQKRNNHRVGSFFTLHKNSLQEAEKKTPLKVYFLLLFFGQIVRDGKIL